MKLIPTKVLLLIIVCLSLSLAEDSGDLSVSGTSALTLSGLDCTANTNGGALTANADGVATADLFRPAPRADRAETDEAL